MQLLSRPMVVALGLGLALVPAACSTLKGSGGSSSNGSPADSTVFRTITVEVQTSATQPPDSGGTGGAAGVTQNTLDPSIYEVQAGDSWYGIARKLKVDVNALLRGQQRVDQDRAPRRSATGQAWCRLDGGRRRAATSGRWRGQWLVGRELGADHPDLGTGVGRRAATRSSRRRLVVRHRRQAQRVGQRAAAANGATTKTVLLVGKYLKVP